MSGMDSSSVEIVISSPTIFVSLVRSLNFNILGLTFSPVKGPEGNIEFLGHLTLDCVQGISPDTAQVVADAHATLKG